MADKNNNKKAAAQNQLSQQEGQKKGSSSQDSLLACLMFLTEYYRHEFSAKTLVAGLPLRNNRLTPFLFVRSARRAGLNARVVERKISKISPHVLPAVVLQENEQAAILTEKHEDGSFTIFDPETLKEKKYVKSDNYGEYLGVVILVHPAARHELPHDVIPSGQNWFWGVLKQFSKLYAQVGLASIFINLMAIISPLFIMNVYDRVVPNAAFETLWVLAIGIIIAYVFDFIFKQLRGYFIDIAGKGADILLAGHLFQQVLNVRLGLHGTSSGAFANQLREFETLRDFFTSATLVTLVDLPFVFLFIFVIAMLGGPLAIIPLVAVPLVLGFSLFVQLPLKKIMAQAVHDMDAKHGHLVETINALETVKSLGAQGRMQGLWEKYIGTVARIGLKSRFLSSLGIHFSMFAQQLVSVLIVVWGVYLISDGEMSMGALIACTILAGRTMAPLSQAVSLYTRFQQSRLALGNLNHIMQLEVERPDNKVYVQLPNYKGNLSFQDVSFSYPQAPLESIKNVNFTISSGEKVGIIGRTGSGKSTVARLALNLYNPMSGSILLDDLEVRQLDPAEFRADIGYVPQKVVLFRGTLKENILMANPDASDEELVQAVNISGAAEFIRRHPMGFDMPIGEGGEGLSGGQRQAVSVARAILKNPTLLLMDEPSSEMDNSSEESLKQQLSPWLQERTLILITHRASLLDIVDRLIVMDNGRVLLDGPKEDVLKQLHGGKVKGKAS